MTLEVASPRVDSLTVYQRSEVVRRVLDHMPNALASAQILDSAQMSGRSTDRILLALVGAIADEQDPVKQAHLARMAAAKLGPRDLETYLPSASWILGPAGAGQIAVGAQEYMTHHADSQGPDGVELPAVWTAALEDLSDVMHPDSRS